MSVEAEQARHTIWKHIFDLSKGTTALSTRQIATAVIIRFVQGVFPRITIQSSCLGSLSRVAIEHPTQSEENRKTE